MVSWPWSRPTFYERLPGPVSSSPSPPSSSWSRPAKGTKRRRCLLLGALLVLSVLLFGLGAMHPTAREYYDYYGGNTGKEIVNGKSGKDAKMLPPDWTALRAWEAALPQHNLELPYPEGKGGRFVRFSNEARMLGWNNCLNEELMNAHLAHASNRAYVFSPYYWAPEHYPFGPSTLPFLVTPLPALLAGPIAGGPWGLGDASPRSISADFWEKVCPPAERKTVRTMDVKPALASADGKDVFARWVEVLRALEDRCVEVVAPPYGLPASEGGDDFPQTFDLGLWGSPRIVSLWESFRDSPVSQLLRPSPIVAGALARNEYLFRPARDGGAAGDDALARTLAVHLRRGDYIAHCTNLASWGAGFYSWSQLPFLLDKYTQRGGEEGKAEHMRRCLPTVEELVVRIREVRADYEAFRANATSTSASSSRPAPAELDTLYLLTNEPAHPPSPYLAGLTRALSADGWKRVLTSGELVLDAEQTEVGGALDMEAGRRAGVFLGNGWSSFTSNIIHQRLVDRRPPVTVRLL